MKLTPQAIRQNYKDFAKHLTNDELYKINTSLICCACFADLSYENALTDSDDYCICGNEKAKREFLGLDW